MIIRGKTRLLLIGLVGFFVLVALIQWLNTSGSGPSPQSSDTNVYQKGSSANDSTIIKLESDPDNLGIVMLFYADGMARVADRFLVGEEYETAAVLLDRVYRVRRYILGMEHLSVIEAKQAYTRAIILRDDSLK